MNIPRKRLAIAGIVAVGLGAFAVIAIGLFLLWPLTDSQLQQVQPKSYSYDTAMRLIQAKQTGEQTPQSTCHSLLRSHDRPTPKAVLLLSGTICSEQLETMAQYFYAQGYNVYAPVAPKGASSLDLVHFADESLNIAASLGQEVGVIGVSSGSVLATWLAEYRTDVVQHLLVMSPLYEPSAEFVPKWQTKAFLMLYGGGILPDVVSAKDPQLSYHTLAQYLRIVPNFKDRPYNAKLKSIGSVVAPADTAIDQQLAYSIPGKIAAANNLTLGYFQPTAELTQQYGGDLYARYFTMYEAGRL